MWRPDQASPNAKIGFNTYAMWGLCFVVIGVCYALEKNDTAAQNAKQAALPADGAPRCAERQSLLSLSDWRSP